MRAHKVANKAVQLADATVRANPLVPTCRYGHGDLVRQPEGCPDSQCAFMAESFPRRPYDERNSTSVYSFHLYKCKSCSYIELHDYESHTPKLD